jgi:hypothetical protein
MRHIMASLTIAACLLLPSAGAVFAADKKTQVTGQPGSASGFTCQSIPGNTPGNAGNVLSSPFDPSSTIAYAGNSGSPTVPTAGQGSQAARSNANTFTAISEYDVACANQAARAAK